MMARCCYKQTDELTTLPFTVSFDRFLQQVFDSIHVRWTPEVPSWRPWNHVEIGTERTEISDSQGWRVTVRGDIELLFEIGTLRTEISQLIDGEGKRDINDNVASGFEIQGSLTQRSRFRQKTII